MELTRREFVVDAAAAAAAVSAASVVAAPAIAQSTIKDGTYITEAISMHGIVAVQTIIKDAKIASVKVLQHRESYNIGEAAVAKVPAAIVETQCVDVDGVSGSTITSAAIKRAVCEAIENAGGDPDDFSGYVAPEVQKTEQHLDLDVAVMGGGPAGLMAAWSLAEAGKKVAIFEKMSYVGGCVPISGGGVYTAETDPQKVWGTDDCVERYSTFEKCIAFRQGQAVLDSPYYNPEMPYLTNTILYGSKAVNKMFAIGVGFTPFDRALAPVFSPGDFQIGTKYSIVYIEHYLTHTLGIPIYKETPVTGLKVENGTVTGLTAEAADGTVYDVTASAVVLASGGYIQNDELMSEYQPEDMKFVRMGPPWANGDGMIMAKEAGAEWVCMDWGVTSHYHGGRSLAEISYVGYTIPGFVTDADGNRFVNESADYKKYLHLFREKEKSDFYWVFDASAYYALSPTGNSYGIDYLFTKETGDLIEGENLDDLIAKTGLVNLKETLAVVNDVALNGAEDPLGNAALPAVDTTGKMYAMSVLPTPYIAQGGVHIDLRGHVLREDGSAIAGLYAAGDVTGAVDNLDGHPYNIGLSQAFAYGLIAGEQIIEDLA